MHCSQLFVATEVEILAKFSLHSLKVPTHIGEIPLLRPAIGLGHRDTVLLQLRLEVAHLFRQLLNLRVAPGKFLLEFLLRALGRGGFPEQAFAIDEADFVVGALREAGGSK